MSQETTLSLFERCVEKLSLKEVGIELNVCKGTMKRWIDNKDVPEQYTFDLYKILGIHIDYAKYSSSHKDQFFTPQDVAYKCYETFLREIGNVDEYTFVEPSAGDGSFLSVLPKETIAMDIEPRKDNILKQDYLTWLPTDRTKRYVVFGNPPFGLRGHLALKFINHSYEFADYVCFILPQLFSSDGKGCAMKRVKGYNLIYSELLTAKFYNPERSEIRINCVFQIWSKHTSNEKFKIRDNNNDKMIVYSLSDGGSVASTRNKDMIGRCDVYIPSTCFGKDNMKVYDSFNDLPGKKGYGIVFKDKELIVKAREIDWSCVSFQSTNSAYNLRTSIICNQFLEDV